MSRGRIEKNRVYREAEEMLKATGLPYRIEQRKKHDLAFLNGELVATMSRGKQTRHDCTKIAASIRRIVRNVTG